MSTEPRIIYCVKLKKDAVGLTSLPLPGPLGKRIFDSISQEAWDTWKKRQVMFINEYRLNLLDQAAKDFLKTNMQEFLFEDKDLKPEGYTPESTKKLD
jgi:Fe-S cluster biosynthesis and repair protein YggX